VLTSAACYLDFVSPLTLYFNYDLIFNRGHYWRLLSSFLFFGPYSLDFVFHIFFVLRYCRQLEEGKFRGRPADLVFMLVFGASCMVLLGVCFETFSRIKFLGHSLSFMMVYVWARERENEHMRMQLLGLITFNAPYLPWVLFLFSLFLRNPPETDILGIIVGHTYYFLDSVYPVVADIRGWRIRKLIGAPNILQHMVGAGGGRPDGDHGIRVRQAPAPAAPAAPPAPPVPAPAPAPAPAPEDVDGNGAETEETRGGGGDRDGSGHEGAEWERDIGAGAQQGDAPTAGLDRPAEGIRRRRVSERGEGETEEEG
jgi:Derlin-2/3